MTNLVYTVEVGKNIKFDWITIDGTIWKLNGKVHREDGPAVQRTNGDNRWCLEGVQYTEERWTEELERRNS